MHCSKFLRDRQQFAHQFAAPIAVLALTNLDHLPSQRSRRSRAHQPSRMLLPPKTRLSMGGEDMFEPRETLYCSQLAPA